MLYRVQSSMGDIIFQVLCEHQSTPDRWMPIRLLDYKVQIWRNEIKSGAKTLPIILPIVFYAGKTSPYPYSMNLEDLFAEKKAAEQYALKPAKLVDFTIMNDEELIKERWSAGLKILLKHMANRDYRHAIKYLIENEIFRFLRSKDADSYAGSMLYYTYEHSEDRQELLEQIGQLDPNLEDLVMTIADSLRLEGMQQGMQKGRHEGILEGMEKGMQQGAYQIAKGMLHEGDSEDRVARITGLSAEIIVKLKQDIQH